MVKELAEIMIKHKFGKIRASAIYGWANKLIEATLFLEVKESSEYYKGYGDCLRDIKEACKEVLK